jgi:HlyD family secretion protein
MQAPPPREAGPGAASLPATDSDREQAARMELLGTGRAPTWRRRAAWGAGLLLLAAVAATAAWWLRERALGAATPRYVTEPARRGDLAVRVTANGTLQPTRSVGIGSELSGTVARVLVDVNDRVHKGQLLIELDSSRLRDQAERSRAALAAAEARLEQAALARDEAARRLERQRGIQRLSEGMYPAPQDLDAAQSAAARAQADADAARAAVADARAAARADATNLAKASIRSPADGVVLARNVDPGNAVAASLQAVTLLVVAEDLARMKLQVNIDEADVGQVHEGQHASFSVSAWPGRSWPATIRRVGYGSTTKDNVVTYLAELDVANDELRLRPGMSAVATIAAVERRDVLLVPSSALRFAPPAAASAASAPGGMLSRLLPRPPGPGARRAGGTTGNARQVWVLQDGAAVAVPVVPGLSDGRWTEIAGGTLREGAAVVVDQAAAR